MKTVVTSREEILRAAGEMVKVGKGDGVSMRGIALSLIHISEPTRPY